MSTWSKHIIKDTSTEVVILISIPANTTNSNRTISWDDISSLIGAGDGGRQRTKNDVVVKNIISSSSPWSIPGGGRGSDPVNRKYDFYWLANDGSDKEQLIWAANGNKMSPRLTSKRSRGKNKSSSRMKLPLNGISNGQPTYNNRTDSALSVRMHTDVAPDNDSVTFNGGVILIVLGVSETV
jgi:hypothetical protein